MVGGAKTRATAAASRRRRNPVGPLVFVAIAASVIVAFASDWLLSICLPIVMIEVRRAIILMTLIGLHLCMIPAWYGLVRRGRQDDTDRERGS